LEKEEKGKGKGIGKGKRKRKRKRDFTLESKDEKKWRDSPGELGKR